jgi:iron(III) transport system permease protein
LIVASREEWKISEGFAGAAGARELPRLRRLRPAKLPPLLLLAPALVVALLALLPLLYLILRASSDMTGLVQHVWRPRTLQVLANTLLLMGAVAATTTALAVPLAWLTTRTDLPGRRFWTTAFTLPLVVPSFVGALAFVAALGPRGLVQQLLAPLGVSSLPSFYGFTGAWLILSLSTLPYAFLALRAAFVGLDGCQEEAARSLGLGPWHAFRRVTLPQLRPAIALGGLLCALYTLGDFGVVTLLRYDSFTRAIYTTYRSSFDRNAAAGLALVLTVIAVIVLVLEGKIRGRAVVHRVNGAVRRTAPVVRLGRWRWPAVLLSATVVIASLGIPLAVLVYWSVRHLLTRDASRYLLEATQTSIVLGVGAALIAGVAAVPIAVLSVRYPGRFSRSIERSTYLTYAMPGIVIAIAFVAITVRTPWYQTLGVLMVACACRYLAQAVGATRVSLLQINPRVEEAARGLGASLAGVMRRVTLPLVRPGWLAGVLLVFLTTIKELPITLLLIPAGERSLPTLIWTAAGDARYGEAAVPALLLVAITAVPTYLLAHRRQAIAA